MLDEHKKFEFSHPNDPNRDLVEVINGIESRGGLMMSLAATIASVGIFLGQSLFVIPSVLYLLLSIYAFFRVFARNPTRVTYGFSRDEVAMRIQNQILSEKEVIEADNAYRQRLVGAYKVKSVWMHRGYGLLLCFIIISIGSRGLSYITAGSGLSTVTKWFLMVCIALLGLPIFLLWTHKRMLVGKGFVLTYKEQWSAMVRRNKPKK
jgi:amino acid transporter